MLKSFLRFVSAAVAAAFAAMIVSGCANSSDADDVYEGSAFGGKTLRILSGSENKELSQILEDCAKETGVQIEMTYKGSVDIMNELKNGAADYDAVWPASSLWISLGDTNHLVKYDESVSTSPVVFGIRRSLAEELGFVGKDVSVSDILSAIKDGKLSFCMTSATQSNSGACAYIGFLYALAGKTDALTEQDLDDAELAKKITDLLSGIDRSSGSSDWLKDMFLSGDFDAMVNYECLIISANEQLVSEGRDPLYVVYPYDGLSIADSPLGYVDHGDDEKQGSFDKVQEYLLSDEVQNEIQKTGRRTGFNGVSEENRSVFKTEWGVDADRILSPITMPSEDVLMKAFELYQTGFRKPSLNVYCLDFSGSMRGDGESQLVEAMSQILIQENAEKNLLQAGEGEVNIVITFDEGIKNIYTAENSEPQSLEELYEKIESEKASGGTDMYLAAESGLQMIADSYDVDNYTPAIILMTDGASETTNADEFEELYRSLGLDVPVFSIMFGNAQQEQLDDLAQLTNARVFDGREDLVSAFRSVKGYN